MLLIKRLLDIQNVYTEWELSWVLEDNVRSLRALDAALHMIRYKTWRLYQKDL